jgi:hypothetical protein
MQEDDATGAGSEQAIGRFRNRSSGAQGGRVLSFRNCTGGLQGLSVSRRETGVFQGLRG